MAEITDCHPNWYTMAPEAVGQEIQVDPMKGVTRWLLCFAIALALLLVDEVVKIFMRRSRS